VLFWATVIVGSCTSYGPSRAEASGSPHAATRIAIQRCYILWSESPLCDRDEPPSSNITRSGLRLCSILQVKFAEDPFWALQ
jgi:hypothetical protein